MYKIIHDITQIIYFKNKVMITNILLDLNVNIKKLDYNKIYNNFLYLPFIRIYTKITLFFFTKQFKNIYIYIFRSRNSNLCVVLL